jgi:predicted  nucleic acid-binding Zn-ribbon protein
MGSVLDSLLQLQDLELQIVDIRRQLAAKQRSVQRQTEKLKAAQDTVAAEHEELKRAQMQQDEVDLDLKSRAAHISKLRDDLNKVKTNKEYAAVLSQLNNEKADLTRLETRAFELLSNVEARKKSLTEQQENSRVEAQRLANLEAQLAHAKASFADRLGTLENRRRKATDGIDAKSLDLFNRISERYEGEVMARVVQPHPRRQEYLCEGCNMSLAAERANALMSRDEVITCDNCGRILHIVKS